VFITHNEFTFNANDGKHQYWLKNGEQKLRPKGRGNGIMVLGFLTPSGILRVPDHISDEELLNNFSWPRNNEGKPIPEAIEYLEYGKGNCSTGEKMLKHTKEIVIFIFNYAFPNCQVLFAFDNLSNHSSFAPDALLVSRMNLFPGGKQLKMRDGWNF
jgi:hypothetical protein